MNSKKLHNFGNNFKQSKYGILGLMVITVLSILLIMAAIHMLTFPNQSADSNQGGEGNSQKSAEVGEDKNGDRSGEESTKGKTTPIPFGKATPGPGGSLKEFFDEKVKKKLPEFSIDLSQNQYKPGFSLPNDSDAFAVRTGQKPPHTPVLEIQGVMKVPLLRMVVMDSYSGSAWHMPQEPRYSEYKGGTTPGLSSVKIKPVTPANGFVPVPSNTQSIQFPVGNILHFPDYMMFYSDTAVSDTYEVFCRPSVSEEVLINSGRVDMKIKYTKQVSPRITELLNNIVKGIDDPRLQIKAIEKYLKENYSYGAGSQSGQNQDAVQRFLFGASRQGTELDFVSTFAFMLRSLDIPCRVVTGYHVKSFTGYQVVYADQIHVYPEVKFENYGWVPLDYFDNSTFYVPPVSTQSEITQLDTVARKGREFTVKGTVTDSAGKAVDGLPVLIYLKKTKDEEVLSYIQGMVRNGTFEVGGQLHHEVDVGSYQVVAQTLENDMYRASWSDPEMKVVAETSITVSIPETVIAGRTFRLSGSLKEALSRKPIPDPQIDVVFDGKVSIKEAEKTAVDESGNFRKNIKLEVSKDESPVASYLVAAQYDSKYDLHFKGSDFYLPASKSGEMRIWVIYWNRIFMLMGVLLAGICMIVALTIKSRKKAVTAGAGSGSMKREEVVIFHGGNERLTMENQKVLCVSFPQIDSDLPLVWGIHEPLVLRFTDGNGEFEEVVTTFQQKGTKNIRVYTTPERIPAGKASIRIVLYGEEILQIGRPLFKELIQRYKLPRIQFTPREIVNRIGESLPEELNQKLQELLCLFERAAYSQKEISRPDFERFYLLYKFVNNATKEEKE